jgi:hypothetical protein
MKKLILASAAALVMSAGVSFTAMPLISLSDVVTGSTGSGKGRGRGRGRGGDDRSGDDSARTDNSAADNSVSGSGRSKLRVPGGSGCDSAGDVAEHASCSPSQ